MQAEGSGAMLKSLSVVIVAGVVLTGCSGVRESNLNPFNWFGQSQPVPVNTQATGAANPLIPAKRNSIVWGDNKETYAGAPVETISALSIERRPGGAIILVTGTASRAGPFEVRLVPDETATDGDTLAYRLLALQSAGPVSVRPDAREVKAALWLTEQQLGGIREVQVSGRSNALVSRR